MRALGAARALNLDGGGSSALALRDAVAGRVKVVNWPSDATERAVGNAITIHATCGR
jgi:exopolysaccharide biosynthesis protein